MPPDITIGRMNVSKMLRDKYKKLGKGWISLIQVPYENHMEVNSESLRILSNEMKYSCVYITLSKSSTELDKEFKSRGVDINNVYYIDAISKIYGEAKTPTKRCIYASGPLDIDSITVSLRELLTSLKSENKCVFLDSITTVMLYNSLPRTLRFSKFLTQTLKNLSVDGVMVSVVKGKVTKKLVEELGKLCNEVITIGGGATQNIKQ